MSFERKRHRFFGSVIAPSPPLYTARSSSFRSLSSPKRAAIPTIASGATGIARQRAGPGAARRFDAVGLYSSKTAWAFVWPKPKAERPARLRPPLFEQSGHGQFSTRTCGIIGRVSFGVAGITPLFIESSTFVAPAKPAATSVCPKLPFVEPIFGWNAFGSSLPSTSAPKTLRRHSSSTASPCGVPVAWHSTYCSDFASTPNLAYVSSRHWSSVGMSGLSGCPLPPLVTCAPSSVP